MKKEGSFKSNTGLGRIYYGIWASADRPTAVIQIAHGMAEHSERYNDLTEYFNEKGFAVIINDHAGHGRSIQNDKDKGHFGDKDGWINVIKDMKAVHDLAVNEFPGVPMILLGHSMGSFLAREYAALYPQDHLMYIFSGTAGKNKLLGFGRLVTKAVRPLKGAFKTKELLQQISSGNNNKRIQNAKPNAWLTSSAEIVDAFNEDPLCGFAFTAEAMLELLNGIAAVSSKEWAKKVPDVPICLLFGEQDPVGNYGAGPREVMTWLQETGHHHVEMQAYQDGRHEMHNERNSREVFENLVKFIAKNL